MLRALEKDPARRFPDADEFIAALQAAARRHAPRPSSRRCRAPPLDPPSEAYAYPEEPLEPREPRDGGRWWLWLLARAGGRRRRSPPCCCSPGTQKVAVPTVVGADQANAEAKLRQDGLQRRHRR